MFHKKILMILVIIAGLLLPAPISALDDGGAEGKLTLFPTEPCSLEFRAANVKNVLRSLAKPYRVNLLVSERVGGKITASFHEVPVREVFLAILQDAGLGYIQEGNILRVDTIGAIQKYKEKSKAVTEMITKNLQVNYAFDSSQNQDLTELATELRKLLSKAGGSDLSVITRTNTLVVTDFPESVAKIEGMLVDLDKPSHQIAIMSQIVSVTSEFDRELGIQWGGSNTNNFGSNQFTVQGGNNTDGAPIGGQNYAVNLPAASVGQGAGGAINLLIGKIGNDLLEMQLSAMESDEKGKVLANPKVITQDNQSAKMESVHKIWYMVTNRGTDGTYTTSYQSEDVKIILDVTPHVIEERIFMDVKVEKGSTLPRTSVSMPPEIKTNNLTTKVMVGSGETVVIGGLVERDQSDVEGGVPLLKDIPLLGWLFKYQTKNDEKKRLLIFITPTILKVEQKELAGQPPVEGQAAAEEQAELQKLLDVNEESETQDVLSFIKGQ